MISQRAVVKLSGSKNMIKSHKCGNGAYRKEVGVDTGQKKVREGGDVSGQIVL